MTIIQMKAWKVSETGRLKIHCIPEIEERKVEYFTKTRVYLNKNTFENIETYDPCFTHKWFKTEKEAALAYDNFVYEKYGDIAFLNFPRGKNE